MPTKSAGRGRRGTSLPLLTFFNQNRDSHDPHKNWEGEEMRVKELQIKSKPSVKRKFTVGYVVCHQENQHGLVRPWLWFTQKTWFTFPFLKCSLLLPSRREIGLCQIADSRPHRPHRPHRPLPPSLPGRSKFVRVVNLPRKNLRECCARPRERLAFQNSGCS